MICAHKKIRLKIQKKNLCRGLSLALGKGGLCRGPEERPSAKNFVKKKLKTFAEGFVSGPSANDKTLNIPCLGQGPNQNLPFSDAAAATPPARPHAAAARPHGRPPPPPRACTAARTPARRARPRPRDLPSSLDRRRHPRPPACRPRPRARPASRARPARTHARPRARSPRAAGTPDLAACAPGRAPACGLARRRALLPRPLAHRHASPPTAYPRTEEKEVGEGEVSQCCDVVSTIARYGTAFFSPLILYMWW